MSVSCDHRLDPCSAGKFQRLTAMKVQSSPALPTAGTTQRRTFRDTEVDRCTGQKSVTVRRDLA
jgi:hypothetical protein